MRNPVPPEVAILRRSVKQQETYLSLTGRAQHHITIHHIVI